MVENYRRPRVVPVGDVRANTHGSGDQFSDPGGHSGYTKKPGQFDTVETVLPLPDRD